MAAEKGSAFLLKLGSGSPVVYATVAGLKTTQLTDATQLLLNASDDALAAGANLTMVGAELIQFGRAAQIGPGHFRLSRLVRGQRGSEWAVAGHGAGERFLLVDQAALVPIALDPALVGASVTVRTAGVADDPLAPPTATLVAGGEALRPPSPCGLKARAVAGGGLVVEWLERSRNAWAWSDGSAGSGETGRTFVVSVNGREFATDQLSLLLSAVDLAGLGTVASVSLVTVGAMARSRAATALVS